MTYAIKSKSNGRYNTNGVPMPLIRYPLDATGLNPDNRVVGEIKTLANTQVKAVVPTYGPIYADGLVVVDNLTNIPLVKGIDYSCVQLLQEATLRFGKEIFEVILIKKPDVSSTVRINYQVLGGLFQNNAAGIESLYQAVMNNNTPISWENVLNKPYEYTPTLHNHMLQDVVGFEPLVVALERVRNAITLTDVASFEALIAWVNDALALVGADKANSFHTHPISDIDGLQTIINNLQNANGTLSQTFYAHTHAIVDVTGLQTILDNKADIGHAHTVANVSGLQTILDAKSSVGHNHDVINITGLQAALDTKAGLTHIHTTADISGLDNTLANLAAQIAVGGATGGGTDDIFYENSTTVNTSYTITSNKNAMSAGPITIADGVTVTVPNGSTWSVI
jgi:Phage tail repeat like